MSISNVFIKDPNATLDYGFDWSQWLQDGESISSYIITAGCGINKASDTNTSASVIVWLTSGCAGNRYSVACKITTSANRIDERTIKIDVRER
jgi:hypothetical protein